MSTPFDALQTLLNEQVVANLADATADFGSGDPVPGLFRDPVADALGMGGSAPTFQGLAEALDPIPYNAPVTIKGKGYRVAEKRPESGLITLILEAE